MTRRLTALLGFCFVLALSSPVAFAQEKEGIGYGGTKVQLHPMMVPARDKTGDYRYEVLMVRLILDVGANERPGCFAAPIVHEHLLMYLYGAKLTHADLVGARLQVLQTTLLNEAIKVTAKGFYSGVEIVTEDTPPITDPKSMTMTNQCR
jgi:hypothetical protein